jgi:hypothetical protein
LIHARDPGDANIHHKDPYNNLLAVVFLGTPHRGSAWVDLGRTVSKMAQAAGFSVNKSIVNDLKGNSQTLSRLREGFLRALDEGPFFITTCQEGVGLTPVGYVGLDTKVGGSNLGFD